MTESHRAAPVLAAIGLGMAVCAVAAPGTFLDDLLTDRMGFSEADLRALDDGSPVIRSLDTPIREELAHAAAVYLDTPSQTFVDRFRDIVAFEFGPGVPQIGRFDSPPSMRDLASLTLPDDDLATLRDCEPGDCDVKLSAAAMARLRNDVDWSSPDAGPRANEVVRAMILDLVREYQTYGNAALGHYDDGDEQLAVAEQFRAILESSGPLPVPVPELLTYLDDYPRGRLAKAEEFFYWTVVDFGLKPTIRVNHVTIYPMGEGRHSPSGVAYAIAIKQLYASHYFHTTLELRFLLDHPREGGRGAALISLTRSRNDGMTGFKGLFLRPIIRSRSRNAVRNYLAHVKRQVEEPLPVVPE